MKRRTSAILPKIVPGRTALPAAPPKETPKVAPPKGPPEGYPEEEPGKPAYAKPTIRELTPPMRAETRPNPRDGR